MSAAEHLAEIRLASYGESAGLAVRAADLSKSAPPRWAWQDRLVIGYLNLLIGNEGVGKGTLMAWTIARLTRGELPGDLAGKPIGVGVLGDEDSFADVWTPRLHAAGADLDRVFQIERPDGGFVNVAEDRDKLTIAIAQYRLGMLFFDQLLDNLGAGTDDWRQKAVREALQPIRALARELEIVTLGALHPNKRADSFRHSSQAPQRSTRLAARACSWRSIQRTKRYACSVAGRAICQKRLIRSSSGSTNTASVPTVTTSPCRWQPALSTAHSRSTICSALTPCARSTARSLTPAK